MQAFIYLYRPYVQDTGSDRPMTVHGLRHICTAEWYQQRIDAGMTPYEARKAGSQHLGHGRDAITGKTQKEVAQKLREITVGIDQGTYRELCKLLLSDWMDIWLQDYTGHLKPRTVDLYRSQVDHHIRLELGSVSLEHLTPHMIQHFYNNCTKTLDGSDETGERPAYGELH